MVRRSFEERIAIVREWKASGINKRQFCKDHNFVYSSFCKWCQKADTLIEPISAQGAMQVVHVGSINLSLAKQTDSGVRLEVGNVRIGLDTNFSTQTLARVIEVLQQC